MTFTITFLSRLLTLVLLVPVCHAEANNFWNSFNAVHADRNRSLKLYDKFSTAQSKREASSSNVETEWLIQDSYTGQDFFDRFDFFTTPDPTHGLVHYVDKETAFNSSLAYVDADGQAIMQGDNTTWLEPGVNRSSVRISSQTLYHTGLFILDVSRAPWGCGVWPAWWLVGPGNDWPNSGEIDIIEGVHDNEHNQVTWHTGPNCTLTPSANFTGTIVDFNGEPNYICNGLVNDNSGCGVTQWSQASYGERFDSLGGGVFAMKWDEDGIAVWSFYRAAVPDDVTNGVPDPSSWGLPVAALDPATCDPLTNFANSTIVFDITFCGDWAGNTYTTSGCPGSCPDHLQDPNNFVNAVWAINSLKIYRKQKLFAARSDAHSSNSQTYSQWWTISFAMLTCLIILHT